VHHLTNLYVAKQLDFEKFILVSGGVYPLLFWVGQVALGSLAPIAILAYPALGRSRAWIVVAALLVVLGAFAQMYVTIIGGQAYPLQLFPGMEVSSSFFDGVVHPYVPSVPEIMLGLGGVAVAAIIVLLAVRLLRFLPESLDSPLVEALEAKAKSEAAA
jgi:molybdopterin-containing oxidoreductase family membrane subunit